MIGLLARRLIALAPTLLGVLVIAFLLLQVAPGDPVAAIVGDRADPATVARLRVELRLDEPLPRRFVDYVVGIFHGDLGTSFITRRPISHDLIERFPATLRLAFAAMLFAAVTGMALGVIGAIRPGGWWDGTTTILAYLGVSFPVYWVGLLLILVFALTLRWLPPSGSDGLSYLVLPALTLGMRSVAIVARMTRTALAEALQGDFVRTARAKGLSEWRVVLRHGLRNALLPVITVIGLDFGSYLTGSILTETIFSWPGVGRYVLNAITKRDLPAVQGSILFLCVTFVFVNLLTDLCYAKADPRVAFE
ncbi:MAG: ABC transporter permease [Gemmatimonadales bacterium]